MIDHLTLTVRDLGRSKDFYREVLEPLGYGLAMEFDGTCGFGAEGKPSLWLGEGEASSPLHLAFLARDRPSIDLFHLAALKAGGKDNGPPGVRAHYHPNYYAAFVIDPDGHNIEAVCHLAPAEAKPKRARKAVAAPKKRLAARSARKGSGGNKGSKNKGSKKKSPSRRRA
jgi:catechol 2,3-dioxygenase-like lactoylglutathione lyase family enzyme